MKTPKLVFVTIFAVLAAAAIQAQTVSRLVLRGHHVPPGVAQLPSAGRLESAQSLELTIGLPLRNQAALDSFLQELYDPASPSYRHFLTPQQFTELFGPTKKDYAAVVAYAQANGFTVTATDPGCVLVSVRAPVAVIEKAFHVNLQLYKHPREARNFFAPDAEPTLDLAVPIQDIGGLDDYVVPHPAGLVRKPLPPAGASAAATPQSGSGSGGTYAGDDFRAAYAPGVTLTGTGQSVGLLEFGGYYSNDIVYYENTFESSNYVPIVNVLLNSVSNITNNPGAEEALDIEMQIAMAPGISSIYYYDGSSVDTILSRIASDNTVHEVSASWLYGTSGNTDGYYQQLAAQGITFLNASGDSDAYPVGTSIDACCSTPYVTSVGGTTLSTTGPGGSWSSETVWNWGGGTGGSGGISTSYTIPSWQTNISMIANQGSTTMRNIPDVALTADNIDVYYNGSWGSYGGTSCATPLWAGFLALVNQQAAYYGEPPIGALNPVVYAIGKSSTYADAFHDITAGNNYNSSSPTNFPAVAGYDLCTGWGTPMGQATINALVPPNFQITPLAGFISYGPPGGPFGVNSQNFILTNVSSQLSFTWFLSNTSAWLNVSFTNGSLAPNGSTTVTVSLNPTVVNSLAAGSYSTTILFTNQNQVSAQTRTFSLVIGNNFDVWTGGNSPNGNWSSPINWLDAVAPNSNGDNLVFAGSVQPISTNNLIVSAGWVQLNPGVALTIFGNSLSIAGGLTNSAQNNTWNLPLTLNAGQNFAEASGTTLTLAGVVSGGNGLVESGPGTLLLAATNTYTGPTTINAGTLTLGGTGTLGGGSYVGNIVDNGSLAYNSSSAQTLTGVISGTGTVLQGGGNLTLAAANTYSGSTTISAGSTLVIAPSGSLGSGKNYANVIAGGGGLTYNGTGTQTLSGVNTYSGPTLVNSGILLLTSGGSAGTVGNSAILVNNGAELDLNGSDVLGYSSGSAMTVYGTVKKIYNQAETLYRPITLSGGTLTNTLTTLQQAYELYGGYIATAANTTNAITRPGQFGLRTSTAYFTNAPGSVLNISAVIYPYTSGCPLNKQGAGKMVLSAANTYSGNTVVGGGILALTGSASIASSPAILMNPSALFDVSGLASTFTLGSSQSLTAGNPGAAMTNINGNFSSGGTINVAGSGMAGTLSVNGNVALTGGTLIYDLGSGVSDLITLEGVGRTLSLGGTITVSPAAGVVPNGTYTLVNGITSVTSGGPENLVLSAPGTIRGTAAAAFTTSPPNVTMTVSGGTPSALLWKGSATNANWDVTTTSNWLNSAAADEFYNLDMVTFGDSPGTNYILVAGNVGPSSMVFNNTSTVYALTGSGGIVGGGSLTNSGNGTLIISGTNHFAGGTTISAGTVCVGSTNLGLFVSLGENPASLGTGPLNLTGGTLKFAPGSSGSSFYFTNPITLNGGIIWGEDGEQHLIGPLNVGAVGGTLTVKWDTKSLYVDSLVTGSGPLTVSNANNNTSGLHLSNPANNYSGTVTVKGSIVQLDNSYALSNAIVNLTGGTLAWGGGVTNIVLGGLSGTTSFGNSGNALAVGNNNSSSTYSGALSGTGTLTKLGTGTLILAGSNTYSGATLVNGGTLLVNGSLAAGSAVTVAAGATLGGSGIIGGLTVVSGTLAPGTNGVGRLTISSNLVLAGQTLIAVSKNGGVPTNTMAVITRTLTEGGMLTVTNIGTNALAAGNSFKLFNAGTWAGGFTNFSLPALANGLHWNLNTLATNGTLAVAWNTYNLTYAAGLNGTLSGAATQTVNYGSSGSAVTAVPNAGYNFVSWSDGSTANPRTDNGVTNNISVTANFAISTYTLTYTADANGTISGTTPQTVSYGASGTAVTAVPNAECYFVNWSDGSTANPRTDAGVTTNLSVTANFAINTYTLTYLAGTNGTLSGATPQMVNYGTSGLPVSAIPGTGYSFVNWSDGSTANPRTDLNVTSNLLVTANFVINTYTLIYAADTNGTIGGTSPQTVNYGASGDVVSAVPNLGYSFTNWSDGLTANPRIDTNVTTNVNVTANFVLNTYTLAYLAGTNGTISGITPQSVNYGTNGTPVSAVPNPGFAFLNWSDGRAANPRTDTNVTNNLVVTAIFINSVPPVITGMGMSVGGGFTLGGTGGVGQTYILLTLSDLLSPVWTPIATNNADTNGFFNFSDAQATNFPQRFYRLLSQ